MTVCCRRQQRLAGCEFLVCQLFLVCCVLRLEKSAVRNAFACSLSHIASVPPADCFPDGGRHAVVEAVTGTTQFISHSHSATIDSTMSGYTRTGEATGEAFNWSEMPLPKLPGMEFHLPLVSCNIGHSLYLCMLSGLANAASEHMGTDR